MGLKASYTSLINARVESNEQGLWQLFNKGCKEILHAYPLHSITECGPMLADMTLSAL